MILLRDAILVQQGLGNIVIEPFDPECVGPNSYDVHLSQHLATLKVPDCGYLDAAKPCSLRHFDIPAEGFVLLPGITYLGSTIEYTETYGHVPMLEGKSSVARLGIEIHRTAGFGDNGFRGFWTLEMTVIEPVRVYAGMPIGQLVYHEASGPSSLKYGDKSVANYNNADPRPQASRMFKNFPLRYNP